MVSFNVEKVLLFLPELLSALPTTLFIMLMTSVFGSLLGGLLTWAQLAGGQTARNVAKFYIFVLRCTPPIVLLFMVFYGLPVFLEWWLGLDINTWSRAIFVLISLILLFGAMLAEVFKSAFLALPIGQLEAGLSIGLTPVQTVWRILLPQAFRIALPNMTTALLNVMKDAALAYTIGLVDVMGAANLIIGRNTGNYSLETYTAVALIYWGIALVISFGSQRLESMLSRGS